MFRRVVKICCYQDTERQKLMLQIFDVREEPPLISEKPAGSIRLFASSPPDKDIRINILNSVRYFNLWAKEATNQFLIREDYQWATATITGVRKPLVRYEVCSIAMRFPVVVENFQRLFGALESCASYITRSSEHNHRLSMTFHEEPVNTTAISEDFLYQLCKHNPEKTITEKSILSEISAWMRKTIDNNAADLRSYVPVSKKLEELHNSEESLTRAIQKEINPHNDLVEFLKKVNAKDPEIARALDFQVPLATRTAELLQKFIANPAKIKADFFARLHHLTRKNIMQPPKQEEEKKQILWEQIIKKVIGRCTDSNKTPYTEKHSEVMLLCQAKLRYHQNGLVELLFKETDTYVSYYARSDYAKFIPEMKKICKRLELPLHPDYLSHDRICFNEAASLKLLNYGLFLSKRYIVACIVASHRARQLLKIPPALPRDIRKIILQMAAAVPLTPNDLDWAYNRQFTRK